MAIDTTSSLTLKALGDHLWESENLFRNKISNQKDYVLALLFFKRACDRHAEELATAIGELDSVPNALEIIDANPTAYHSILIPEGCSWDDVRNMDEARLGQAMNDALAGIGRANPQQLAGVFESIDFNNRTALPAEDLSALLDHFEALGPLTNERAPADLLGQAYEWIIARFAAAAGRRGGEFYTPAQVGKLGARLLAPEPGDEIYDPTCGSGGLLLQVLAEAHRLRGDRARTVSLFGQELNPETWAIARMNMLLHGAAGAATIVQGDTLAAPAFLDDGQIRRFAIVVANPPFSSKNWGHERLKAQGDPFGRIRHIPKKSHGEMAFVQHMVASLADRGRMAVVLPNGCFFRGGGRTRRRLPRRRRLWVWSWHLASPVGAVDSAFADYAGVLPIPGGLFTGSSAIVLASDGTGIFFRGQSGGGFKAEDGYEDLTLTKSGSTYFLGDEWGNETKFEEVGGQELRVPTRVKQPGSETTTTFEYEVVSGVARPTRMLAPVPGGVTCGASLVAGCRALEFDYATQTTAVGDHEWAWGDYEGRLRKVVLNAYDPAVAQMAQTPVSRYEYDSQGRLRAQWDPRISPALKETYSYNQDGVVSAVAPPGLEPWSLEYETTQADPNPGRLKSVSRDTPAGPTATTTLAYDVPLSGQDAPHQMDEQDVAAWGQEDVPTDATAIFPADQVPNDPPTEFDAAEIHYLNADGDEVNVAAPGAGVSTMEYNEHRAVWRELDPANRELALAAQDTVARSRELDTQRTFSPDGLELLEELGPVHTVELEDGRIIEARAKTVTQYDQGAPESFHLPTTMTTGAYVPATEEFTDTRVTQTGYGDGGWELGLPTSETTDPGGLNLISRTKYDPDTGLEVLRSRPKANGSENTAHTTKTLYYTAGAHPSDSQCANKPWWANLVCKTVPAGQPGGSEPPLLSTKYEYDMLNNVTLIRETDNSYAGRTTKVTYDAAGRELETDIYQSGYVSLGTDVPAVSTEYDPATGLATKTSATFGTTPREITRSYDSLGRLTGYTDADGVLSSTTYDLLNRPKTVFDGKGTQTFTYDALSGHLVALEDSAAGTFTGAYDAAGRLVSETLPNGVAAETSYDETGQQVGLTYTQTESCVAGCQLLEFSATESIHGQTTIQESTLSDQELDYDAAGRLTRVEDHSAEGECVQREYEYDANSNRTALKTIPAQVDGSCGSSGSGQTTTYSHDAADRLIGSGYSYDAWGRTLTAPGDEVGGDDLTATYFENDLVRSLSQGAETVTFDLDPALRPRLRQKDGQPDEIQHYSDDSEAPSWTTTGTGRWTRSIIGMSGLLVAIQSDQGEGPEPPLFQLTNLTGDVAATASSNIGTTELLDTYEADEFGVPQSGPPLPRYGWLGGRLNSTELASGAVAMESDVYIPALARSLQSGALDSGVWLGSWTIDASATEPVAVDDSLSPVDESLPLPTLQARPIPVGTCRARAFRPERIRSRGLAFGQGRIKCWGHIATKSLTVCIQKWARKLRNWKSMSCNARFSYGPGRISIGVVTPCKRSLIPRSWRVRVRAAATGGRPIQSVQAQVFHFGLLRCK